MRGHWRSWCCAGVAVAIVLVIILAFILIGVVSYVVFIGSTGTALNEGITEVSTKASPSRQAGGARKAPRQLSPDKAFKVGQHKMLAGWKVERDTSLGDAMFSVTGKVKNVGDATATAHIQFRFIGKSGEVLGNVQCTSADIKPGRTQALNCIPDGKYGAYKEVTAEATY